MKRLMYIVLLSMLSVVHAAAMFDSEEVLTSLPPLFDGIELEFNADDASGDSSEEFNTFPTVDSAVSPLVVAVCLESSLPGDLSVEAATSSMRAKRQRPEPVLSSASSSEKAKPVCTYCNKHFSRAGNLKVHIKSVHKEERQQCPSCGKNFTQKSTLNNHVKSVHEKLRYQCSSCEKSFTAKSYLKIHTESVHKKERHRCPSCDHSFTCKRSLHIHIKSVHEGEKHQCSLCEQCFTQKSSLTTHIKSVHKKERYQCTLCTRSFRSFSNKSNLSIHIKSCHPEIDSSSKRQRGNG